MGAFLRALLIHIVLHDKEIRKKKLFGIIVNYLEHSLLLTIFAYTFGQKQCMQEV